MTQPESDLIDAHLGDRLEAKDHAVLQELLRRDVTARRLLRDLAMVDTKLEQLASDTAAPMSHATSDHTSESPTQGRLLWLNWRPLTAAAAGITIGLFSATVAWAVASPRAVATAERLFALVNGSFEAAAERPGAGFPRTTGVWSGDDVEPLHAEIVGSAVVKPREGRQMLRFVKALGEATVPKSAATACDVFQLVDLRPLRESIRAEGASQLELSAEFLDARAQAGAPVRFTIHLYLFEGQPEQLHEVWPRTLDQAVGSAATHWASRGGTATLNGWKNLTTRCVLTAQADFAVVQLSAGRLPGATGPEAVLGEQFADAVQLTLKTQPNLRVRAVQR